MQSIRILSTIILNPRSNLINLNRCSKKKEKRRNRKYDVAMAT